MSLHAARAAVRAAVDEAYVAGASAAARAWHESRGDRRSHASRASADDRPKRPPGPATVKSANPGPQHLPNGCQRRGTPTSISPAQRATTAVLFSLYAEQAESHPVARLQEESVVRYLLGRNFCRLTESNNGDAVDGISVRYDQADTAPGLDCEASGAAADHHAVGEEYASAEACAANGDRASGAPASDEFGRSAAAALVRQFHPAEAAGADAAQLSVGAEAFVARLLPSARSSHY